MGWLIFFGYLSVILLPPLGLILGSVLILKQRKGHGLAVIGLSISAMAIVLLIPVGDDQGPDRSPEELVRDQINGRLHAYQLCLLHQRRLGPCGKFLPWKKEEQP